MIWYTVKIIYRITSGDGTHTAQFDEQLRLINAANEHAAFEKANSIGIAEQSDFLNEKQETVKWEFIAVTEINQVNSLADGAELYYTIHETPDAERYMEMVRRKAHLLSFRRHLNVG